MTAVSLAFDTPDLAAHYEHASVDRQFKFGKQLIERIGIQPGQRVLDVGSGTGLLAEHVAGLVGPTGFVQGVDPLPLRIDIAKKKARPNLAFSVDDAYDLSRFEPASFDVVYLNAVFHWFPEKVAPLRNFERLLKPGGKLGLSTGSRDHRNQLHELRKEVLGRAPFSEHVEPTRTFAQHVTSDELRGLLAQTGFDVQSLGLTDNNSVVHADANSAIQHFEASSFGNFLGHLPESLRDDARSAVIVELEKLRTPEGIRHTGARIVAVATKR
jgi:arsenite methyltransferase